MTDKKIIAEACKAFCEIVQQEMMGTDPLIETRAAAADHLAKAEALPGQ